MSQQEFYKVKVVYGHNLNDLARENNFFLAEFVAESVPGIESIEDFIPFQTLGFVDEKGLAGAAVFYRYLGFDVSIALAGTSARWASRRAIGILCDFAFNQLACGRLTANVGKKNKRSRKLLEGLGFKLEGCKRRGLDGVEDLMVYGMLKESCRWINKGEENAKRERTGGCADKDQQGASKAPSAV